MKTIKEIREEVFNILESFDLPIFLQGSMSECAKYPKLFITYFLPIIDDILHVDNNSFLSQYIVEVAVYGNNIDKVDETVNAIKTKFKENYFNFVIAVDVASDTQTHTGIMQRFIKIN